MSEVPLQSAASSLDWKREEEDVHTHGNGRVYARISDQRSVCERNSDARGLQGFFALGTATICSGT